MRGKIKTSKGTGTATSASKRNLSQVVDKNQRQFVHLFDMDSIIKLLLGLVFARSTFGEKEDASLQTPPFPSFAVSLAEDSFWENFQSYKSDEDLFKKWHISRIGLKDKSTGEARPMYPAKWTLQEPYYLKSFKGDQCLSPATSNAPAMIGRVLPHPLDIVEGTKLVVQYEVQLQNKIQCGGAFLKLLPKVNETELIRYSGGNPVLELIFGPDKCLPYTDEVHLGLKKTDPITGQSEMKMLTGAPPSKLEGDRTVRLYTLVIDATTQDYEIRIDGQVAKAGNLLDEGSFQPSFHAPKQVPDLEAEKPDEWDEREIIPDPDAEKPEYWDESEPAMIPNDEESKPASWDETMPEYIPDPSSKEPEWWNTAEDGEWVAPLIRNPDCFKIAGCGPWSPHMIENPDYWGPWTPPSIENPNYMGKWEPPLIDNPNYFENLKPAQLENSIGGVVFEFWSGSKDLLIDNLYIGLHLEEAESLGNQTFIPKKKFQEEQIEADIIDQRGHIDHPKRPPTMEGENTVNNLFDQLTDYVDVLLQKFAEQSSIVQNIVGGSLIVLILGATSFFFLKLVMFQQDHSKGLGITNEGEKGLEEKEKDGLSEPKLEGSEGEPQLEIVETQVETDVTVEVDMGPLDPASTEEATGISLDSDTLNKRG